MGCKWIRRKGGGSDGIVTGWEGEFLFGDWDL